MLGKLIKNEFINRGKQAVAIMAAFLLLSVVLAVMGAIDEYGNIQNDFFQFSYGILIIVFSISVFVVVAALLIGALQDFGNRLFKEQGYLTHTLPVKISSLILARMVFDLVLFVAIAIVIPVAICIATRDFSFFSNMGYDIRYMLYTRFSGVFESSIVIIDIILICVALLINALSGLWMFNASYAIGHAFNNAKRLMSVVAFCVIATINWTVTFIVGYVTSETGAMEAFADLLDRSVSREVTIMISLIVTIAVASVSVAIYAVITSCVCKKRLNLE